MHKIGATRTCSRDSLPIQQNKRKAMAVYHRSSYSIVHQNYSVERRSEYAEERESSRAGKGPLSTNSPRLIHRQEMG